MQSARTMTGPQLGRSFEHDQFSFRGTHLSIKEKFASRCVGNIVNCAHARPASREIIVPVDGVACCASFIWIRKTRPRTAGGNLISMPKLGIIGVGSSGTRRHKSSMSAIPGIIGKLLWCLKLFTARTTCTTKSWRSSDKVK